jgi:hypothetical protein
MQRLNSAENSGQGFIGYPNDVVEGLLRYQRAACGMDGKAELHRSWVFGAVFLFQQLGPHTPRRPNFCYFFEEINMA